VVEVYNIDLTPSESATADADPSGPVDFERVRKAAERSGGMKILGPPPFKAA